MSPGGWPPPAAVGDHKISDDRSCYACCHPCPRRLLIQLTSCQSRRNKRCPNGREPSHDPEHSSSRTLARESKHEGQSQLQSITQARPCTVILLGSDIWDLQWWCEVYRHGPASPCICDVSRYLPVPRRPSKAPSQPLLCGGSQIPCSIFTSHQPSLAALGSFSGYPDWAKSGLSDTRA